ncbi:MAG: TAXI family TRAP transporter solute-binding subunit [Thermodesulfobacteriota bacterium]
MKRGKGFSRREFLGASALIGGLAAFRPSLGLAQAKKRISIATGGTGGVYYPYGGGMANVISKYLPGVEATAEVTSASVDNMKLVGAGKADLALTMVDTAFDAAEGKEKFKNKEPIMTVAALYTNFMHVTSLAGKGIKGVADLKGRTVSTGSPNSGTEVMALRILEAFGLNPEKDVKRDRLGVTESAGALKDGKIDAFFWVGGLPTAAILDLAATPGVTMSLVPHDEAVAKLSAKYGPIYFKETIPKTAYPHQTADTGVAAIANILVCNAKAEADFIYNVLKVFFEHQAELVAVHKEAKNLTLEKAVKGSPVPFHPGAVKFFKEKGKM